MIKRGAFVRQSLMADGAAVSIKSKHVRTNLVIQSRSELPETHVADGTIQPSVFARFLI